ncbi:MAG: hypothetical protein ACR652_00610 [Methylocystis sp.]|uniref:hypothetical protein n=1 Tax=Methylocystis sp. TaxID=1911079 RepID=UPI003DA496E6
MSEIFDFNAREGAVQLHRISINPLRGRRAERIALLSINSAAVMMEALRDAIEIAKRQHKDDGRQLLGDQFSEPDSLGRMVKGSDTRILIDLASERASR